MSNFNQRDIYKKAIFPFRAGSSVFTVVSQFLCSFNKAAEKQILTIKAGFRKMRNVAQR
jgi:hypothetical protein